MDVRSERATSALLSAPTPIGFFIAPDAEAVREAAGDLVRIFVFGYADAHRAA